MPVNFSYLRISSSIFVYFAGQRYEDRQGNTPIFVYLRISSSIFVYLRISSSIFVYLRLSSSIFVYLRISSSIFVYLRIFEIYEDRQRYTKIAEIAEEDGISTKVGRNFDESSTKVRRKFVFILSLASLFDFYLAFLGKSVTKSESPACSIRSVSLRQYVSFARGLPNPQDYIKIWRIRLKSSILDKKSRFIWHWRLPLQSA